MKVKVSEQELAMLYLPEKLPSLDTVEKLVLPHESNLRTKLDLTLTPYLTMPVECIGDNRFFVLGFIGPTQGGKSTFLQIAVADNILQTPGTALYVLPDRKQGIKQLNEKVIQPIQRTPELSAHIVHPASKTMTQDAITLDHMTIYLGWSNSKASLSSTPCMKVYFDEARLFKKDLGNESNAIKLGLDRLTIARSMGLGQAYIVSTPSDEGDLLAQQLEIAGTTILWWYWLCPHCQKYFIPDFFNQVRPIDKESTIVNCHCPLCHKIIETDQEKRSINSTGAYGFIGQDGVDAGKLDLGQLTERVFFRFCSMSSPFRPFQMIYNEYLETRKHVNDYKNFWQCWLARFWRLTQSTLSKTDLESRKGEYVKGVVPEGTKVITAGGDTQDDGWYIVVRAWGENRDTWIIDEFYIACRMGELPAEQIADLFKKQVEDRIYKSESGQQWQIAQYAIDTGGHRTTEMYAIAEHLPKMCMVKGRDDQTETIIISKQVFGLFLVRTGDYLEKTENACLKSYWHLPKDISEEFLVQWLNAKKTSKKVGNKHKIIWDKAGQNDFRYADVHSYIALDLPWSSTTLSRNLETPNWTYNPIVIAVEESALSRVSHEQPDKEFDDYSTSKAGGAFSFKW